MSSSTPNLTSTAEGSASNNPLIALNSSFLKSGIYSDMVLRCEGKDIKVHKLFICTQSKPVAAALSGRHQTCEPGVFELLDCEWDIAMRMVEFLYTGTYAPPVLSAIANEQNVDIFTRFMTVSDRAAIEALKIYVMGDRYDLQGLKNLAKNRFEFHIKLCNSDSFLEILQRLYTELPPGDTELRSMTVEHICAGSCIDELLDSAEFKDLCDEIGQVGFDIMKEHRRRTKEREQKEKEDKATQEAVQVASALPKFTPLLNIWCCGCRRLKSCTYMGDTGAGGRYYTCNSCGSWMIAD